ncbi:MAG TPA: NAD(P)H-binding protein [Myxococcales bacterium]|nr:NAD(P)H-binding protein [Myxococcales bacterium]
MTTVLVAGATGAVGTALVPRLRAAGFEVIPHVRPKTATHHPLGRDPVAFIADLGNAERLDVVMARAQAVVCLVGTMRRRFSAGDTYESSDYLPVVQLAESARRVPSAVPRQFVLLSALGARSGGGYLGWKFKAEEAVRKSGLPNTVLRPSFLDSTHSGTQASDGTQRKPPPFTSALLGAIGHVPGLRGASDDLRPLPVETLCDAVVRILRGHGPQGTLTGRELWPLASAGATTAPA